MEKIGLFYGSDTGCTEAVSEMIQEQIGEDIIELHDAYDIEPEDFDQYDKIIIGLSTWHDGQLVSAWDDFYDDFQEFDFTGKTVAFFGLGDQYGYSTYFIDGVGILGDVVLKNGGKLIGYWPTDGFEHDESKAETEDGKYFMGLAIDEDNQDEMTEERVTKWVEQIKKEFPIES
jgi:flavodoxin I